MAEQENQSKCVFNIHCTDEEKIILFTSKTLNDVKEKLKIRQSCNIAYNDIVLPEAVDNSSGYHSYCKKLFCKINKKNLEEYKRKNVSSTATPDNRK